MDSDTTCDMFLALDGDGQRDGGCYGCRESTDAIVVLTHEVDSCADEFHSKVGNQFQVEVKRFEHVLTFLLAMLVDIWAFIDLRFPMCQFAM